MSYILTMPLTNEIQAQNIPRNINPKRPDALKMVIELAKDIQNRLNRLEQEVIKLKKEAFK